MASTDLPFRKAFNVLVVEEVGMLAHFVIQVCERALGSGDIQELNIGTVVTQWASNCRIARDLIKNWEPNLIVMDLKLPDGCGSKLVAEFAKIQCGARILGLSSLRNERSISRAQRTRFDGFVLKSVRGVRDLEAALKLLARGGRYFSSEFQKRRDAVFRDSNFHGHFLTARESQVLDLIAGGLDNVEVARTLSIEPATAHKHRQSLLRKLDVHTSPKLVARARLLGFGNRFEVGQQ